MAFFILFGTMLLIYVAYWIYKHNRTLDYKKLQNQNIIITGSSTGIGKQIALECAKGGANIIITGLEHDLLSSVANECKKLGCKSIKYIPLDLSTTENCKLFVKECLSYFYHGKIDYLFLNHISPCPYTEWINNNNIDTFDTDKKIDLLNKTVSVYIRSHMVISTLLYKYLEQSKGKLIYVSSLAGYSIGPYVSLYGASKHGMSAFLENWRSELRMNKSQMSITICKLSLVATKKLIASVSNILSDSLIQRAADPNDVAKRIISGGQNTLQFVYAPFLDAVAMTFLTKISKTLSIMISCKANYGRFW